MHGVHPDHVCCQQQQIQDYGLTRRALAQAAATAAAACCQMSNRDTAGLDPGLQVAAARSTCPKCAGVNCCCPLVGVCLLQCCLHTAAQRKGSAGQPQGCPAGLQCTVCWLGKACQGSCLADDQRQHLSEALVHADMPHGTTSRGPWQLGRCWLRGSCCPGGWHVPSGGSLTAPASLWVPVCECCAGLAPQGPSCEATHPGLLSS